MMQADNRVRVIKPFRQFRVGQILEPYGVDRQRLLFGGFIEVVKDEKPEAPKKKTPGK